MNHLLKAGASLSEKASIHVPVALHIRFPSQLESARPTSPLPAFSRIVSAARTAESDFRTSDNILDVRARLQRCVQ